MFILFRQDAVNVKNSCRTTVQKWFVNIQAHRCNQIAMIWKLECVNLVRTAYQKSCGIKTNKMYKETK